MIKCYVVCVTTKELAPYSPVKDNFQEFISHLITEIIPNMRACAQLGQQEQCCVVLKSRGALIIGLAISYRLYIGLVFAYWYWIGNMCKQVADRVIHKHLFYGHLCSGNILAMPVYVMSAVDHSPLLSLYNQI